VLVDSLANRHGGDALLRALALSQLDAESSQPPKSAPISVKRMKVTKKCDATRINARTMNAN